MIKRLRPLLLLPAFLVLPFLANAQHVGNSPGVPGACGYPGNMNLVAHTAPNPSPLNGNGTMGVIYDQAKCGLDYTSASQRLGKRFSPAGVNQPAPFVISGIPSCAVIEKAYLWTEGSGNGAAQTATVNGPLGSANYPMTIVGQGPDKCWGYSGSYTYRADVTPSVNGNGTYNISGILTNPPTSGNDMDGATLLVIWSQASAPWQGRVVIADGAMVVNGGTATYNLPLSPAVCGPTTNARAFCGIGDIQMAVTSLTLNGTSDPITWNWWNFEQVNTTVANAQATAPFVCNTGGDCFNLCIAGLYFRTTTCAVCPSTSSIALTTSSTPATCSGCNGTATVTPSPAGSYTYSWNTTPTQTSQTATGLCAGTYVVTVTSSCNTATATVTVNNSGGSLSVTSAQTNVLCNGQCNGSTTLTVTGGTAPYTFAWSPSVTNSTAGNTNTATGLCAGTYVCTVTDAGGCTGTQTVTITQPTALSATFAQTNVLCNAATTGNASITMSGGTSPYTFSWSPAVTNSTAGSTNTATGLGAGTYVVTATDANGCSLTHTYTITQPTALSGTFTQTNVLCNGGTNGNASITMSGGTGPYTFTWSPAVTNSTAGSTNTATGLGAGTYVVTATDANGCTFPHTFTITQPTALSGTFSQTNQSCSAAGTATITMSGGVSPYTFTWSPAVANSTAGNTNTATGLTAGTYVVTSTDANGCTFSHTFTITTATAMTATYSQTNVSCNGGTNGTASATVSGGTTPYTFTWTPSVTNSTTGSTNTATGLAAGTYVVTISDAAGCSLSNTFTITQPPALSGTFTQTNVLCNAATTGNASITMSGGVGPYTFTWAPAVTNSTTGTTNTATGLAAGTYVVTATDANGCTFPHTFTITQPTALSATFTQTDVACNGGATGSASITMSGGVSPYTFTWSPATTNSTTGSTNTATGLTAGTYVVTSTDANGCTFTHTFNITQPTPLTATSSTVTATCGNANGSATVTPSGGVGPYSYAWSSGGSLSTEPNLAAGTYNCVITDFNLCSITVTVTVPNAGSPTATLTASTNVTCFGACDGTATVTGSGGTAPYTFSWSPATTNTTTGNSNTATGLCPGTYVCTVSDANGCSATASVTITQPTQLTVTTTQVDVLCNGNTTGSATATASGGTGVYTFTWSPAVTNSTSGNTNTATGLGAGAYVVTVTDANNCTASTTVTITEPSALTLAAAGFNATCNNACNGQLVVIPTGGTPTYTFLWSTGCSAASCNNVCAGTYNVTVTDFNGCVATATATVTQPPAIVINTTTVDAHCNQSDGSAVASASGGTGTLTYTWLPGNVVNDTLSNVPPGNYCVVVSDQNGCSDTVCVTINNIPGVTTSLVSATNVSCFGGSDGQIICNATSGTSPYTYSWSCSSSTTTTASNLPAGTCTFTATDAAGCWDTTIVTITQPLQLTVTASANPTAVCSGQSVQISASGGGGTPVYQYAWAPGPLLGQTQTVSPTSTQQYTVVITDAHNCVDSTTVTVTINPNPVAALSGDSLSGCAPLCVNFSDLSTVGAPSTITAWSWDFGDGNTSTSQNPLHCYSTPGVYTVILNVTTSSGCTNSITMPNYINVFANPVAEFTASPQPTTELNPEIFFTDQSTGASAWSWSFGDTTNASSTLQNPSFIYGGPGCFDVLLTVTTANGCVDTTMHQVCIDPDVTLFVPNAFTPNGDGINDVFYPLGIGIDPDKFEMWIFDRWGNLIFYTDDMAKGWNGYVQGHDHPCQIDTYVWKIKAYDQLGKKHNLVGKVSLIR